MRPRRDVPQDGVRRNEMIRAREVRVIGADGEQLGILQRNEAIALAKEAGMDLVEVASTSEPPVCRIMDYGKFKYEQSIREKQQRKSQKATQVKEIKFHPGTDVGDIQHKLKQIREFLADGNKVRLSLQFRGRENAHRDIGEDKIAEVLSMIQGECSVEQAPKTDGRIHFCLIGPPRKNAAKAQQQPKPSAPATEGGIHISVR